MKIIQALLIYLIGKAVVKKLIDVVGKSKAAEKMDPTVKSFVMNAVKWLLYAFLVIAIIRVLGVETTAFSAVLASVGVAVGLALQGALGNLAGGLMLLIFRPFKIGDYVAAGGEEGTVKTVSVFYTVLNTVDNREVTIPNGTLMNSNVTNFSSEELRRVDLSFNLTGSEDIDKVRNVILDAVAKNELALTDPAPFAAPVSGIPGGLEYTVRVWTKSENYWDAYFTLLQGIATALGEAGIGGPLPATKVVQ